MSAVDPSALREQDAPADPLALFARWYEAAVAAELPEPSAMTLATATPDGVPSARIVLLRGFDERGFTFFTNYQSRKGAELTRNPRAALVFYWELLRRQIRVEGRVEVVSAAESDMYFRGRPFGNRLGAVVSPQSEVIPDRETLEARLDELCRQYTDDEVPRPAHWGGYRVVPATIEFWQGRANRLHDRLRYRRDEAGWRLDRLAP